MTRKQYLRLAETTSVLLFSFQALRVIFSVLFGILYDGLFEGPLTTWVVISVLLLVVVFLFPMLLSNRIRMNHLSFLAIITAVTRLSLSINDAQVRYWGAIATLLVAGVYLAAALRNFRHVSMPGMALALSVDQLLRVMGHTYDVSLRDWWFYIQIIWILFLGSIWFRIMKEGGGEESSEAGLSLGGGLALGGFLFLQTSLLSMPNAVTRWADGNYAVVTLLLLLITLAFLTPVIPTRISSMWGMKRGMKFIAVAILLLGLMAGYFLSDFLAIVGLLLAHAMSLWLVFYLLQHPIDSHSKTGFPVTIAFLLLVILNFLNAFAFTYPYTVPVLRGLGWVVYLIAGAMNGLGVINKGVREDYVRYASSNVLIPVLGVLILAIIFVWPPKTSELPTSSALRIATYNIHYGYDDEWHFTLEEIADTIEANLCDVVAMQEVDTGRLTSYAVDDAFYLAHRLKMNVAYLPAVEYLTGIALLYRGPQVAYDVSLLTSLQEQTGIIHVPLGEDGSMMHAYGIWMGLSNEDTERQISEALDFISDRTPAVFGGDFNAEPDSPIADRIREAGFDDPFTILGIDPPPFTAPAIEPRSRIDFVWIRNLEPTQAWVPQSLASDHRMVVIEVEHP
jgi:endonuclease/exonuclease/phosphatase family metal-dependent hydrolase